MSNRKNVKQKDNGICLPCQYGGCSLIRLRDAIDELITNHGPDTTIKIDIESGYYDDHSIRTTLEWERPETDKEYEARQRQDERDAIRKKAAAAQARQDREEQDRMDYARLIKKYGAPK